MLRVGFDVDGVLARFNHAYANVLISTSGVNKFGEPAETIFTDTEPNEWCYDKAAGYTKEERNAAWDNLCADPLFWLMLPMTRDEASLRHRAHCLTKLNDVYFITNRSGVNAKWQTEIWLERNFGIRFPTVLLSATKGAVCRALSLDCYIDDKAENIHSVVGLASTRAYLLDKPYNRTFIGNTHTRVSSLEEFFVHEGL